MSFAAHSIADVAPKVGIGQILGDSHPGFRRGGYWDLPEDALGYGGLGLAEEA